MFCAAFRRFVVCGKLVSSVRRIWPFRFSVAVEPATLRALSNHCSPILRCKFGSDTSTQFASCENMSPRGKARAKKDVDVEENGKEKRVRESRNVKAASYKDLSDSEDEKPRRRKKDSDSESPFEDEKPVKKAAKGKRGRPRGRKQEVSDSEEASEFGGSEESSGEESSSKRRKSARKPAARSLRAQRGTSYKDLSNSEEESGAESKSSSDEDESAKKTKKGRAAKKSVLKGKSKKKEELSESGSENQEEEEEEEEEDDGSVKSKSGEKGAPDNKKDTSAKVKQQSTDEEESNGKVESKSKPAPKESDDEEEEDEEGEEKDSDKDESKKEETESKKRSRSVKNSEDVADEETEDKPSKKAKVEDKPKMNKTESSFETIDFSSEAKTKDGKPWNLKISSWNVAGLRACIKKNGLDFVKYENPDIVCLQETKCSEKKLPPEAKVAGYESYWLSGEKDGHAGVAILSKAKPLNVTYGVGNPDFDNDGRVITAEYEKFFVVNAYVPNAGQGLKTLPRRLEWDPIFRAHLKKLDEQKPVILCGDLNVAHNEIDLTNPKTNIKSAGFTPQEREGMTTLLKEGFVDTFRNLYPDRTGAYSFWSYFNNARSRNIGWRLDYFITSERFLPSVCDNIIRSEVYGSDHCPITLLVHV